MGLLTSLVGGNGNRAAPAHGPKVLIENKTRHRLAISNGAPRALVLAPFERRTLTDPAAVALARQAGEEYGAEVTTADADPEPRADLDALLGGFWGVIVMAFVAAFVLANTVTIWAWAVFGVVATVAAAVVYAQARGPGARKWLAQMGSLAASLLAGLGIPAAVIIIYGEGGALLHPSSGTPLALLGRILQWVFIGVAAVLPALLFYLFDRNRLSTLRSQFERQVFRLDPAMKTLDDVRAKYGGQLEDVYGRLDQATPGDDRFRRGTRWPLILLTVLFAFGWVVTLLPVGEISLGTPQELWGLFVPELNSVVFGFLGVYFFAVTMILRRYVRGDLQPKAYSSILVRLYVVVIFAWVFDVLIGADGGDLLGNDESYQLVVMFLVGVVPEMFLTFLSERLRGKALGWAVADLEEKQPLSRLDGIDLYDRARLLDEGVANIESLAHHDLIDLVVETRIPVARLVDWVDQAILYLHVAADGATKVDAAGKEQPYDLTERRRVRLREFGIRTATDLLAACERTRGAEREALLKALDPEKPGRGPLKYQVIVAAMEDDEWLEEVKRWRGRASTAPTTRKLKLTAAGAKRAGGFPGPAV